MCCRGRGRGTGASTRGRGRASAARVSGGEDEGLGYAALAAKKKGLKATGKRGVPSEPGESSIPRQSASTDCEGLGAAANGRPTPLEASIPPVAGPAVPSGCVGPGIPTSGGPAPEDTEQLHDPPEAGPLRSPVCTGTPRLDYMF